MIRNYKPEDRGQIEELVLDLEKYYPNIENWFSEQVDKIEGGKVLCKVAEKGEEIGGVAISERKNKYTAKLKTFYLKKDFQESALGPRLLKEVLNYWINKRIRKIHVTFAEEEVEELYDFFHQYGFSFAGASPFEYREDSVEFVMNKIQVYQKITETEFQDFVLKFLFKSKGYDLVCKGKDSLVVKMPVTQPPNRKYVKIVTDENPALDLSEKTIEEAKEKDCLHACITSFYSLPEQIRNGNDIETYDGYNLETLFYPGFLERKKFSGGIQSIDKGYAARIIYDPSQMLLRADRKSLRVDNVFYKKPRGYKELERGSTLLFYQAGDGGIIGEGKIKKIDVDTPENLHNKYGNKGVFNIRDIKEHSEKGKSVAILLGITTRYSEKISLGEARELIPNFNPQGSMFLTQEQINKIRRNGGYPIRWTD